jgi:hypothetical protein
VKEAGKAGRPEITSEIKTNLDAFASLDDNDIIASAKVWTTHSDKVLSFLSSSLINRTLYRIEMRNDPIPPDYIDAIRDSVKKLYKLKAEDLGYLVYEGSISNNAYRSEDEQIKILYHGRTLKDITDASDMLNVSVLSKTVIKYFLCYPKDARGSLPK